MKPLAKFFALIFLVTACTQKDPPAQVTESVSIIQLIATPERFESKKIEVIGYIEKSVSESVLYMRKDDRRHLIFKNALWLDSPNCWNLIPDTQEPQAVLIEGTFSSTSKGKNDRFSGGIVGITECRGWEMVID